MGLNGQDESSSHLFSLKVEHIAGSTNQQADYLRRATIDPSEWALHPDIFKEISWRFSHLIVDLFTSPTNVQVPCFFSKYPTPGVVETNALCSPWPSGLLYVLPPLPLIPVVIRKILMERAEVLLVVPHWARHPWFADLKGLLVAPPWRIPLEPLWFQLTIWHLRGIS